MLLDLLNLSLASVAISVGNKFQLENHDNENGTMCNKLHLPRHSHVLQTACDMAKADVFLHISHQTKQRVAMFDAVPFGLLVHWP